jgi:hypothetical protein
MLLDTVTNHDLQTQGVTSQTFQIETNAITFQLLTANLYKNPIASIIRELTSNAWDAHVEAGNTETPIEIDLPNSFSNELIIKDFGTGLSVNDIFEVYTVLFRSTRRNSNDFFGGKGLGCKTPFAYSDTFIVESRFEGTLYTYNMFLNEERIPSVALINETSTTEPNGLTIRIAVNNGDYHQFNQAADRQLILFPSLKINRERHAIKTIYNNAYGLLGKHPNLERGFFIRIGHILYDIDLSEAKLPATCLGGTYHYNFYNSLILNGAVGQLDITPNREDLNYTPKTKKVINELLSNFKEQFLNDTAGIINRATTLKEANRNALPLIAVIKALSWNTDMAKRAVSYKLHEFSDYVTDPLPDIITKFGELRKKRKTLKIEWSEKVCIHLPSPLYINVVEPKTPHLTKTLQNLNVENNSEYAINNAIVIESTASEAEIRKYFESLTYAGINKIRFIDKPTAKNQSNTIKQPQETYYYKAINSYSLQQLPDEYYCIKMSDHNKFYNTIGELGCLGTTVVFIIPDNHTKRLAAGTDYMEKFRQDTMRLYNQYNSEVRYLHAYKQRPYDFYVERTLEFYKGHTLPFTSKLNTLIAHTKPKQIVYNILNALNALGIPIFETKSKETELDTLIERYRPILNERVDISERPILVQAFDHYLESL